MSIYKNNPWTPIKHSIIKDENYSNTIYDKGFVIDSSLESEVIQKLTEIFENNHKLQNKEGGMFYSLYSQDLVYRKQIFDGIDILLRPYLERNFHDFKVVIHSFVVKLPGEKSEFYLHQDTTGVDERKHSPLSLWIPLQDVAVSNGCLGVIPKSQRFFSPFRSISFPAPFDAIQSTVKKYLQPIPMKKGEVLVFDNRILHNSYSNVSDKPRVAVICGLLPKEAKFITCHKPEYVCGGKVELIEHEDDYLLIGKNFLIDCQKRPETGVSLGWEDDPYESISYEEFESLCRANEIPIVNNKTFEATDCAMISEPILEEKKESTLLSRFQKVFKRA
ncbi:MAG: hypothetical protein EBQ94_13705 [Flavobacteriales bacterium]|nr:hypothetical protein [Flavobacteriales bacterium]NCA21446.1 hypothetical protein [Crocinitomicaceae bacterium]